MLHFFAVLLGIALACAELYLILRFARSSKSGTRSMIIFAVAAFLFPFAAAAISAILWTVMILWFGTAFAVSVALGGFALYLYYKRGDNK